MLLLWAVISFILNAALCVQASLRVSLYQLPDETIRAIVTNLGDRGINLLKHPNSILRPGQPTHKFTFTSVEGSKLPMFDGIQVTWDPDTAKKIEGAYVTIPARGSIYFDHDLSSAYSFMDSGKPQQKFLISLVESTFLTADTLIQFSNPVLAITLSRRRHHEARSIEVQRPFSPTTWSNCNARQKSSLALATSQAKDLSTYASTYFENIPEGSVRYPTWFGPASSNRDMFVTACLSALQDLSFESYTCGGSQCDPDIIAYVFPSRPDLGVSVCDAFWSQLPVGPSSRAGTLIHEASHLVCGTDDNCYGRGACKRLAIQDPDRAVGTASSYMYFIENEPYLY